MCDDETVLWVVVFFRLSERPGGAVLVPVGIPAAGVSEHGALVAAGAPAADDADLLAVYQVTGLVVVLWDVFDWCRRRVRVGGDELRVLTGDEAMTLALGPAHAMRGRGKVE